MGISEHDKDVLLDFRNSKLSPIVNSLSQVAADAEATYRQQDDPLLSQGWQLASLFLHKLFRQARSLSAAMLEAGTDDAEHSQSDFYTGAPYRHVS